MDKNSSISSRRSFLKKMALFSAMTTAATLFPGIIFADEQEKNAPKDADLKWKKAPCRFCGVGCGVLIGLQKGKAVAVKGDPKSSVNKGLCCVKGYHSVLAIYGKDRLTKPLVKKNGKMVETSMKEALDLIASKMQQTIKDHGKDAVSMYGSGQWTIPDGYAASKFMKGAIGTNNLEANARLCMASAVTGFMTSFGIDEPMGCYEDIDHADVFILWGNNMAEMHPVLFSRLLDQRMKRKVKIIDFATRTTRTSMAADRSIIFEPQTDLAVANAICYEIIDKGWVNKEFVKKHISFSKGKTKMGYGTEDFYKFKEHEEKIDFNAYKEFLKEYTPEKVARYSGVSVKDIRLMANIYGDPNQKVMSFWCMGMNQHTRGTWINNLVYNIHLLTGKISTPGNSPFSLTGQPSACGTVREVGTLTHKLPHGVVTNKEHREFAAKIWKVPVENIPAKPTYHTVEMFRALDRGDIKFMWIQVTNPMVTMPNLNRYREGCEKTGRFIVVSDIYPTPTTDVADVILPSAMWIEREGLFGNSERRTQYFEKMIDAPGEAISDSWQIIEVARRMGYGDLFPKNEATHAAELYEEYRLHQAGKKHGMAPLEVLKNQPGAMWPFVDGKSTKWRFNTAYDPACDNSKGRFHFYGKKDGKAVIWQRPYEPAAESPDKEYNYWLCTGRVIEHWHTGSMTRRIDVLHQAVPHSYVEVNPDDAKRLNIREGDKVKITSKRGTMTLPASVNGRGVPVKGQVFVPFFDEGYLINDVTLDAFDPISKQPDYKKCAVKIEKV
ncbi:molybdopterin-dependent oxidoreductase [Flammeovirga kamogawensis]|uniref:Nitrate reductase n=1 Tax=Flammeovirga kamogawensis TaxID=373891 RepID=A0ABX8H484_9BACT|nr:molybdopterin-dependent oxidoreductase [Flammeovirga kamogawensis]MBB6461934.1 nitrate reductase NapA [Flammeovirga kamogawensis]QWG10459.1 molybdopterin-dependent oxidoreductase [Flammeovirga kamogawensis]TRX63570.1 molybdopterin-dependent oxidoreductase [Flammeovirga kamogawensis]